MKCLCCSFSRLRHAKTSVCIRSVDSSPPTSKLQTTPICLSLFITELHTSDHEWRGVAIPTLMVSHKGHKLPLSPKYNGWHNSRDHLYEICGPLRFHRHTPTSGKSSQQHDRLPLLSTFGYRHPHSLPAMHRIMTRFSQHIHIQCLALIHTWILPVWQVLNLCGMGRVYLMEQSPTHRWQDKCQ